MASISKAMEQNMFEVLINNDQFAFEKKVGNVAYHFEEGEINFAPTYKVKKGEDCYKISRIPGWTDRIIFFRQKPELLVQKSYDSNNDVKLSDHRPVFSQFELLIDYEGQSDSEEEKEEVKELEKINIPDLNSKKSLKKSFAKSQEDNVRLPPRPKRNLVKK